MKSNGGSERLFVPALRGTIGKWVYYSALMSMAEIAARVSFVRDVHQDKGLNDAIQRELRGKAFGEIRDYLLSQEERFFNSLVLGVYGGFPEWYSVAIRRSGHLALSELEQVTRGILGIVLLRGDEQLVALDGQHRVAGIKAAVAKRPALGTEQVSVLFVAHEKTAVGMRRTRRLFTTLNRYAKPVSTADAIVQDEDDAVAIITRRLIDDYPLFSNEKTLVSQSQAIPPTDKTHVVQIVSLYKMIDAYLQANEGMRGPHWRSFKRRRPGDSELERLHAAVVGLWDSVRRAVPEMEEAAATRVRARIASKYRTREGGHLLFRPAGLDVFARSLATLLRAGISLRRAVRGLATVPMTLNAWPWRGLLWNPEARTMLTQKDHRAVAQKVFVYLAFPVRSPSTRDQLRTEWAKVLQVEKSQIRLPGTARRKPSRRSRGK